VSAATSPAEKIRMTQTLGTMMPRNAVPFVVTTIYYCVFILSTLSTKASPSQQYSQKCLPAPRYAAQYLD